MASSSPWYPYAGYHEDGLYFVGNFSCQHFYLPSSIQLFESLGNFGVALVTIASVISAATVYLAVDACSAVCYHKETTSFKINACAILSVYPIASLASLAALALPRSQLFAEAITQASLTISLYRLFELLVEVGSRQRGTAKPPNLELKVGPCCCWPCLPLPSLELNPANVYWLRVTVLQLPFVQGLIYCVLLFMSAEAPVLANNYVKFLQPFMLTSILLAVYGLTVITKTLQQVVPEVNLQQRVMVSQMVLLFSKLQGILIKGLVGTGLFPCDPPLTPTLYANVTYNSLMVVEMLLLCYAARLIYVSDDADNKTNGHEMTAALPTSPQQQPPPADRVQRSPSS